MGVFNITWRLELFLGWVLELNGRAKLIQIYLCGQNGLLGGRAGVEARLPGTFIAQVFALGLLPAVDHLRYLFRTNACIIEFGGYRSQHRLFQSSRPIFDPPYGDVFAGRSLALRGGVLIPIIS